MSRLMRAVGSAACVAVWWATAATAYAQSGDGAASPGGTESLGSRLMDGLPVGPDLPAADRARGGRNTALSGRDEEGEDIGGPSGPLPLVRAQYGMRAAQTLLAGSGEVGAVARAGRVQEDVVSELDALIAELSKQCRSCAACQNSGQKAGECQRPPTAAAQVKPGHGKSPARDSSDRLDRNVAQPVDSANVEPLLKRLWGHLPERLRDEMLQSYSDGFLPQYELELEKYYRRLAEEQNEQPAQ